MVENSGCLLDDCNGLWSWYLHNLRCGEFEELSSDIVKCRLMKRLVKEYSGGTMSASNRVLLVSVPDDIRQGASILEEFLRSSLPGMREVRDGNITKLTGRKDLLNGEDHYLINDTKGGVAGVGLTANRPVESFGSHFQRQDQCDNEFSFGHSNASLEETLNVSLCANTGLENVAGISTQLKGIGFDPVSNDISYMQQNIDVDRREHTLDGGGVGDTEVASEKPRNGERFTTSFKANSLTAVDNSKLFTFGLSSSAISTCKNSEEVSIRSSESYQSYDGEVLARTLTREEHIQGSCCPTEHRHEELYNEGDSTSELSSACNSVSSDCSIFPSISISGDEGDFRIVLQSILIYNTTLDQLLTAVRQSNNDTTVADINDDWLLYDERFSMNNIQMVSLIDIFEMNGVFPKILFYSVVAIPCNNTASKEANSCAEIGKKNASNISNWIYSCISQNTLSQQATTADSAFVFGGPRHYRWHSSEREEHEPLAGDGDSVHREGNRASPLTSGAEIVTNNIPMLSTLPVHSKAFSRTGSVSEPTKTRVNSNREIHKCESHSSITESRRKLSDDNEDMFRSKYIISKNPSKNGLTKISSLGSLSLAHRERMFSCSLPGMLHTVFNGTYASDEHPLAVPRKKVRMPSWRRLHKQSCGKQSCGKRQGFVCCAVM
ncbi:Gis4p Ecym_4061 [Eremothecium cymbalariae DBVPG|uniref:Uncharacterized protein n=1 Tax=Eremothecium cymbalariae (strain CBS 270.75 / DBVPG 7215 / KCTC 17166 / NRRL Y-17582) TaxID=931890 RepID=G8JSY8_ERECY|nr:hypothetical protein Ecym_4061 [Eremothecium cymbalariae DBVPG\